MGSEPGSGGSGSIGDCINDGVDVLEEVASENAPFAGSIEGACEVGPENQNTHTYAHAQLLRNQLHTATTTLTFAA